MAAEKTSEAIEAAELVDFFSDKFSEWYGNGHIVLACHAAFPVSVTVDMLYQVWGQL